MNNNDISATMVILLVTVTILLVGVAYYWYYSRKQSANCNAMTTVYGELNGRIRSISPQQEQFQHGFRDYYIKSAYNCCSGGNYKNDYVDLCALKNVLKQGVRGLDFEVFSIDDQPVIATSTTDNFFIKETFNYVPLTDAMKVIRDYAFSTSTAPNANDPIVLHFRIKSNHMPMYDNFAKLLESYDSLLLSKEYDSEFYGQNFGTVPLTKLMGKIIIIVDKSNPSFMECPAFYKFVNMTSNSVFMRALHYYDIKFTPDMNELIEYNKQNMTIGMPDKGPNPSNPSSAVMRETGVQMLAMRYQNVDANIEENDVFFDNAGFAFVLKPIELRYVPVTIEMPDAQNPDVSFATKTVESNFYKFQI